MTQIFQSIAANIPHAIVIFDSPGGAAMAGIRIGEMIRAKQYRTFVKHDTMCASACALAWLGGADRAISLRAAVGFHAAYDTTTKLESGWGNALIGAYLARLSLSDEAIYYITHEGPSSIQWLTAEDATKVGIAAITVACDSDACTWKRTDNSIGETTPLRQPPERELPRQITGYFSMWSSVGDGSYEDRTLQLDFQNKLQNLYTDNVWYFNKYVTKKMVIADKEAFMAKPSGLDATINRDPTLTRSTARSIKVHVPSMSGSITTLGQQLAPLVALLGSISPSPISRAGP